MTALGQQRAESAAQAGYRCALASRQKIKQEPQDWPERHQLRGFSREYLATWLIPRGGVLALVKIVRPNCIMLIWAKTEL